MPLLSTVRSYFMVNSSHFIQWYMYLLFEQVFSFVGFDEGCLRNSSKLMLFSLSLIAGAGQFEEVINKRVFALTFLFNMLWSLTHTRKYIHKSNMNRHQKSLPQPTMAFCLGETLQQMTDPHLMAKLIRWPSRSFPRAKSNALPSMINAKAASLSSSSSVCCFPEVIFCSTIWRESYGNERSQYAANLCTKDSWSKDSWKKTNFNNLTLLTSSLSPDASAFLISSLSNEIITCIMSWRSRLHANL